MIKIRKITILMTLIGLKISLLVKKAKELLTIFLKRKKLAVNY
jgi:hypothetical protein